MSATVVAGGMTVGQAVREARGVLEAAGVADAKREADELYGALVRGAASAAWLDREQPSEPSVRAALREAAQRRAAGWPQAYATGRANFRGHWLAVDRRVLIPRPETEGLVDLVLDWIRRETAGRERDAVVVDVCTGSGAVAIAVALETESVRVIATDCSAEALDVARANVEELGVADHVELRRGDLLQPLGRERVDVVVSNPPYVADAEWSGLDAGVREHEPREALVTGPDGMAATRALVASARAALRPEGLLALEVDARRAGEAAALAAAAGFASCSVLRDLFGRPRYLRARRPADGGD